MKEHDYILCTNIAKVRAAIVITRDVLPGKLYGISDADLQSVKRILADAEETMSALIQLRMDK